MAEGRTRDSAAGRGKAAPKGPRTVARRPPAVAQKRSAHDRGGLTESAEDYLECIANLVGRNGYASVSDVADELQLVRPSVSLMIKRLADLGLLERKAYRGFVLTAAGQAIAASIQARHAMLEELFAAMGLDPQRFRADIEGIEHHLSEAVFRRFGELAKHLKKHPLKGVPPSE